MIWVPAAIAALLALYFGTKGGEMPLKPVATGTGGGSVNGRALAVGPLENPWPVAMPETPENWRKVQGVIGANQTGVKDSATITKLKEFQASFGLTADAIPGKQTWGVLRYILTTPSQGKTLTASDARDSIWWTAIFESDGAYDAINADGEFRGLFGQDFWAYNFAHIGLSYGLTQYTQDGGGLGSVFKLAMDADPSGMDAAFDGKAAMVLALLTKSGPSSKDAPPRGVRVQKLDGRDLWEEPWLSRFKKAAWLPAMQAAQWQHTTNAYFKPAAEMAFANGLYRAADVAVCFDITTSWGRGGAQSIMNRVKPTFQRDSLDILRLIRGLTDSPSRTAKVRARRARLLQKFNPALYYNGSDL